MTQPTPEPDSAFPRFLKFWRGVHDLSQEELAHQINSSPRHISRLENGSSRPSRAMVIEIARALNLGQRDRNHLLVSAGHVPVLKKLDFQSPDLRWLRKTMTMTLRALEPYPTSLMDKSTNILMVNKGWIGFFLHTVDQATLNKVTNNNEFLFSRRGAGTVVSNWENTLSALLMSLEQQALFSNDPEDLAVRDRLASHPNLPEDWKQRAASLEPKASFRVQVDMNGKLKRFFSVNSSVGAFGPSSFAPESDLFINTLYPEDDALDLSSLCEGDLSHPLLYSELPP